jgi:oxygen-independent coproporphyrinogen-3 oxidase
MKLYLSGHDCKYAVEQILLTLYPEERPVYVDAPGAAEAVVSFSAGRTLSTARCTLRRAGAVWRGSAAAPAAEFSADELSAQRVRQRLVKLAFYRAAVRQLGRKPAWGAVTGIRPAKLMAEYLESGLSPRSAISAFCRRYDADADKAQLCLDAAETGLRSKRSLGRRDICLYVGIPFCPTRCAYCSFVSASVQKSLHLVEPYLAALEREIAAAAAVVRSLGLRVVSVYVGGGTPTTLTAAQLAKLIGALRAQFDLAALREFCVEAGRPDTITEEKMRALRRCGVDRVSINPQSMEDSVLRAIGRSHTAADILAAYETVRRVGGMAVNMDLIAGLPGDSPAGFSRTLDAILALGPENVTVHTLSHKKGSALTLAGNAHLSAGAVGQMLAEAGARLTAAGYAPYYLYRQKFTAGGFENVGWCTKGQENLYNVCIMEELCSILALGGGASTKLVSPAGRIERIFCPKYPQEYIALIEKVCADKSKVKEFFDAFCPQ